nr:MAG TPA: hypothetical protein [Bacteriophage sp.]
MPVLWLDGKRNKWYNFFRLKYCICTKSLAGTLPT